jgi:ABC-type glycerol-3-phosphate transport system permease component
VARAEELRGSCLMESRIPRIGVHVLMVLLAFTILFPLYFMVVNGFKSSSEFANNPLALPQHFTFGNYVEAVNGRNFGTLFLNSLVITTSSVLITTAAGALAGFAFAKFRFKGRDALFNLMLPLMVIPPIVLLIPEFEVMSALGLVNTFASVVLIYIGIMLPFTIYLLRNFFVSFPTSLIDAALVDGCTYFRAVLRIVLPLSAPALATVVVINAVFAWNELLIALVFLQDEELRTLMIGVSLFRSRLTLDVPALMAGLTIATVPIVVLYLAGQRYLIEGLLSGAVKD